MRRLLSVPVLVTVLATGGLLAGCGSSTGNDQASDETSSSASVSTSPSDTASPSDTVSPTPVPTTSSAAPLPDCASVWVDQQELPSGYGGCLDGSRTVKAQKQVCESGKRLETYQNSFWAVPGGPVHEVGGTLAKDPGWRRVLLQCGG